MGHSRKRQAAAASTEGEYTASPAAAGFPPTAAASSRRSSSRSQLHPEEGNNSMQAAAAAASSSPLLASIHLHEGRKRLKMESPLTLKDEPQQQQQSEPAPTSPQLPPSEEKEAMADESMLSQLPLPLPSLPPPPPISAPPTRPKRLANLEKPLAGSRSPATAAAFSLAATASAAAPAQPTSPSPFAATAPRRVRLSSGGKALRILDLTLTSTSSSPPRQRQHDTRTRGKGRGRGRGEEKEAAEEEHAHAAAAGRPTRRQAGTARRSADSDEEPAAASLPPSPSCPSRHSTRSHRSSSSRPSIAAAAEEAAAAAASASSYARTGKVTRTQAKEMGLTPEQLKRLQEGDSDDDSVTELPPATRKTRQQQQQQQQADSDGEDSEPSVGPRSRSSGRKRLRKITEDEDASSEEYKEPNRREKSDDDDDDEAAEEEGEEEEEEEERGSSASESESNSEEEEEEETDHGRYPPRRNVRKPLTFAEEQARELTAPRRSRTRAHGGESSSDDDGEEDGGRRRREHIQISYERTIPKQEVRLSDGRVVSDREYRAMLRSGEQVRVLADGEEPDEEGETDQPQSNGGGGMSLQYDQSEGGFVRRSTRNRQQVVHYTVGDSNKGGGGGGDSGDESAEYVRARHVGAHPSNGGRSRSMGGRRARSSNGGRRRVDHRSHRRRAAAYGDSSSALDTSSSSSDSSEDEFERKERRRTRRERSSIQPLHLQIQHQMRKLESDALAAGVRPLTSSLPPKGKDGRLADIDPIEVDQQVDWGAVGGLDAHVHALKEMVVLPLLYPELLHKFHMQPPKGVLFFGPPGTGKTLVARALANTCSSTGQKVSFFMRKGADCLSKWVGEAERQLRLLFEQASKMQPSIIFFDEIDGLAPVRSSRQDQIHASIVSTLLALMDGLDNRGQVIVIGATNRVDSIDPALRRPGRFDRELMFTLPNKKARRQILQIHTRQWQPPLEEHFLHQVADQCVGYCGADLKALCTEATLRAVRRRYPQIYLSTEKLAIDVSSIRVKQVDFMEAMRAIVPASQRSSNVWARNLPTHLQPLLQTHLDHIIDLIKHIFPLGAINKSAQAQQISHVMDAEESDEEKEERAAQLPEGLANLVAPALTPVDPAAEVPPTSFPVHGGADVISSAAAASSPPSAPTLSALPPRPSLPLPLRPRFLLHGASGSMGQSHLGPALLHHFEEYPIFSLDLPSLLGDGMSKNAEESCVRIVHECKRNAPALLYWPHIDLWWSTSTESLQNTILMLLTDLPPTATIFLVATADCLQEQLPAPLRALFPATDKQGSASASSSSSPRSSTLLYELSPPTEPSLVSFFRPITEELRREIPRMKKVTQLDQLPALPKASEVDKKEAGAAAAAGAVATSALTPEQEVEAEATLTPVQMEQKLLHEASLLRLQRMSLRSLLQKLLSSFRDFEFRPSLDRFPDYLGIVPQSICLQDILTLLNEDETFDSVSKFLSHIDLLVNNVKEYNVHLEGAWRGKVNKACHMQDVALSMVAQLDQKLVQQCEQIAKRRAIRRVKQPQQKENGAGAQPSTSTATRSNLRSQGKAMEVSGEEGQAQQNGMADPTSSSASSPPSSLPAEQAAAPDSHANGSSLAVSMEVDGEEEKQESKSEVIKREEGVEQQTEEHTTAAEENASASPSSLSPASAAASSSPSPSPSPSSVLLPPPPPLQLDAARLSSLPSHLASLLFGSSVEEVEQVGFQLMKVAVEYQLLPDRNAAMDKMISIAQDAQK